MTLVHFYHCYAAGRWRPPLTEHLTALSKAQFASPVRFGVVGSDPECEAILETWRAGQIVVRAKQGSEAVTLNAAREWALDHDGAVMYAHTKGAHDASPFRARWRRAMTRHVIAPWRHNLAALRDYQVVGCHWLTVEQFPHLTGGPFFGGNFWLARCDYLRGLSPCPAEDRFQAERWIGTGKPRALDLLPGWPADELFAR